MRLKVIVSGAVQTSQSGQHKSKVKLLAHQAATYALLQADQCHYQAGAALRDVVEQLYIKIRLCSCHETMPSQFMGRIACSASQAADGSRSNRSCRTAPRRKSLRKASSAVCSALLRSNCLSGLRPHFSCLLVYLGTS